MSVSDATLPVSDATADPPKGVTIKVGATEKVQEPCGGGAAPLMPRPARGKPLPGKPSLVNCKPSPATAAKASDRKRMRGKTGAVPMPCGLEVPEVLAGIDFDV